MFLTYLRRELAGRRRQTLIVAIGMALAIALVMIVNALSGGVRDAQASVLESVYGVGTDITVTQAPTGPGEGGDGGGRFEFGAEDGETDDAEGSTTVSDSRLSAGMGTSTFDASALDTALSTEGVADAAAALSLTNTTFSGELPDFSQMQGGGGAPGEEGAQEPPTGGADGAGGSAFDVDSFTVLGIDPAASALGPLSSAAVTDGRGLEAADAGADVALLDSAYATTAELVVGDTIDVGGSTMEIVGLVTADTADASTGANVYLPLDTAQALAGLEGQVSTVYVQAASSTDIAAVQASLEEALPDATVNTQEDLASSVSGSLASASTLVSSLGLWLSVAVLAAAFLIAVLFTVSGVTRRTREFGTLKAIGWSNRRVVGQVAGESLVQGLIGGALGIVIGLVGIGIITFVQPTLSGSAGSVQAFGGDGGGMAAAAGDGGDRMGLTGGGGPFGAAATTTTSDIVLTAPVTVSVVLVAVGLAVLGGLVAGAIGGWRASRLRPAEALRSVA
ncbi:membrane protein [Agromyces rhizosphaerae]|uniref:Membrane protein n=1 Tax=Agromyces rhizosphaerae TaxID=88374 RepID=A0A9W6CQ02_9MICO|nr:FtsX-like permease family protein [Agromyces rhizosphaerae]GLI26711.1 membrane protein [Agromyces rhizosphaerae]